jgi:hypothetical protein
VLATRLPFLTAGFGTDNDAWELAKSARHISMTGEYMLSRAPSYPVQEYVTSLVSHLGPVGVNGLTAIMSAIAAVCFAGVAGRYGMKNNLLAGLAFALVPAVMIASPTGMDYMWAAAFLLGSMWAVVAGRPLVAGVLLGLACGTRITSIAFAVPLLIMLLSPAERRDRARDALWFIASAALIGAGCYLPVYLHFGSFEFLSYYEAFGGGQRTLADFLAGLGRSDSSVSPLLTLGQGTVLVWGVLGFTALCVAILASLTLRRRRAEDASLREFGRAVPRAHLWAWIFALATVCLLYWRLPHDEGYLIPAVPIVILLVGLCSNTTWFRVFSLGLIASPFVLGLDVMPPKKGLSPDSRSGLTRTIGVGKETFVIDFLRGPILMDYDKRVASVRVADTAIDAARGLPVGTVVLAGLLEKLIGYRNHADVGMIRGVRFVDKLALDELKFVLSEGRPVYALPDARERILRAEGYDVLEFGVRPLVAR